MTGIITLINTNLKDILYSMALHISRSKNTLDKIPNWAH